MHVDRFIASWRERVAVLSIEGDLDIANFAGFSRILAAVAERAAGVVVDLTRCTFIDSTAWNGMARAQREYRMQVVIPPGSEVLRFAKILGLQRYLHIVATVDEAVTAIEAT